MKAEARYIIVFIDKNLTRMMQAFDVFENFKVIGNKEEVIITYKKDATLDWDRAVLAMEAMQIEDQVAFIHLVSIESRGEKIVNTGKVKPWKNPKIKVISTGHRWYTLDNLEEYLLKSQ